MRIYNIVAGCAALAAALALSLAGARAAPSACDAVNDDLVVNCGFETGDFTGWTLTGDTAFTGVTGPFGDAAPHSGSAQAVFGAVGDLGFLSQSVTTVIGTNYTISIWIENIGGSPNEIDIEWDAGTLYSATDLDPFGYTKFSFTVAGTGSDTLTFGFRQDPSYFLLDDVCVAASGCPTEAAPAVPEPASMALIGTALLGLGAARRRD